MRKDGGKVIIYSGPSGVGKSTILEGVMKSKDQLNLNFSISFTSRNKRKGEINGKNYFFITKSEFKERIKQGEFIEFTKYIGNYYGTSINYINSQLKMNKNLIIEIELDGIKQMQEKNFKATYIFIKPPSLIELNRRLYNRSTENTDIINRRLFKAESELLMAKNMSFDCVIVNNKVEIATEEMLNILKKELL